MASKVTWLQEYANNHSISTILFDERVEQKKIVRGIDFDVFIDMLGKEKARECLIKGFMNEFNTDEVDLFIRKAKIKKLMKNG